MSLKALYVNLIIFAATLPLLASCSSDASVLPADNPSDVYLTLEISVTEPASESRSRAEGDLTYFKLPELECEKLHTLRVIILNASDNKVESNRMVTVDSDGSIINDNLTFKTKPGQKRILLFGNESTLAPETIDLLNKATAGSTMNMDAVNSLLMVRTGDNALYNWENREDDTETGRLSVPMTESWNVTVDELNAEGDNRYQTADLFITRAVTKFSFTVTKSDHITDGENYSLENHEIRSFTIDRIGFQQYLMPRAVYDPVKGEPSNYEYNGRYITSFSVPSDSPQPASFTFNPDTPMDVDVLEKGKTFMYAPLIYLPETPGKEFHCSLTVFDKISQQETTLPLSQKLPNLPSLPRNTHVLVNILLTPGELKCTVDVVPYTSVKLNPTFGFDELLPRPPAEPGEVPPWLVIDPDDPENDF